MLNNDEGKRRTGEGERRTGEGERRTGEGERRTGEGERHPRTPQGANRRFKANQKLPNVRLRNASHPGHLGWSARKKQVANYDSKGQPRRPQSSMFNDVGLIQRGSDRLAGKIAEYASPLDRDISERFSEFQRYMAAAAAESLTPVSPHRTAHNEAAVNSVAASSAAALLSPVSPRYSAAILSPSSEQRSMISEHSTISEPLSNNHVAREADDGNYPMDPHPRGSPMGTSARQKFLHELLTKRAIKIRAPSDLRIGEHDHDREGRGGGQRPKEAPSRQGSPRYLGVSTESGTTVNLAETTNVLQQRLDEIIMSNKNTVHELASIVGTGDNTHSFGKSMGVKSMGVKSMEVKSMGVKSMGVKLEAEKCLLSEWESGPRSVQDILRSVALTAQHVDEISAYCCDLWNALDHEPQKLLQLHQRSLPVPSGLLELSRLWVTHLKKHNLLLRREIIV
ncbi:hypothetical protein GNI_051480 [Gregarina niphandrodes]|uniref:Uncharacterized protein n=1 Tax=Gregarina niphandrodes TaxID=110365 RepID=A0A023B9F4_GRENI|nr:hypothetical protein GNI_051480 [Gregarina niphandrodes]EZG72285.1 hypothetical protein GNI_051480 [Gregarina niphandrodes]|eukprot:XP_011129785.1 hypothetical protein GNI_051480 [Gregarina niphandrodes]